MSRFSLFFGLNSRSKKNKVKSAKNFVTSGVIANPVQFENAANSLADILNRKNSFFESPVEPANEEIAAISLDGANGLSRQSDPITRRIIECLTRSLVMDQMVHLGGLLESLLRQVLGEGGKYNPGMNTLLDSVCELKGENFFDVSLKSIHRARVVRNNTLHQTLDNKQPSENSIRKARTTFLIACLALIEKTDLQQNR